MISVVVPMLNEQETLPELHRRLSSVLTDQGDYELILVDDGSTDSSWSAMSQLAAQDPHLRLVRLSRSFGHQAAITAGLDAARGDAVVMMDGDLQDPPEVISELVARWREGFDVVYGIRASREGETKFKLWTARVFYRLIKSMSRVEIPEDAGDFRLLSRRAVNALAAMPEQARFLRGMTSWIGFRQTGVPYRRDERYAGRTKYPFRKMVRLALDAITSFSTTPIRLVASVGFASVALCFIYLVYVLYLASFTDKTVQGWASVIVLVLFIGGVQLVSLGVIGQYIARIFEEAKRRPLYLVAESVNAAEATETVSREPRAADEPPS